MWIVQYRANACCSTRKGFLRVLTECGPPERLVFTIKQPWSSSMYYQILNVNLFLWGRFCFGPSFCAVYIRKKMRHRKERRILTKILIIFFWTWGHVLWEIWCDRAARHSCCADVWECMLVGLLTRCIHVLCGSLWIESTAFRICHGHVLQPRFLYAARTAVFQRFFGTFLHPC